ncbi:uncharacterized protein LOC121377620 isoform X2 [Gigantopelta aegis]|uniref:uncharacterized protein LOC121377620 isoform X2 n=1 Tax=Gigantopelta aegis TaxID=1735272 RepID=UPI001B88BBCB|nr:uncharacterized protein LOC121377620 isoform X2 [Gigantopelta aegis]
MEKPLLLLIFTTWIHYSFQYSKSEASRHACSDAKKAWDMDACLASIKQEVEDPNAFWFGSSYGGDCRSHSEFSTDCYNPRSADVDSVVSRVFEPGSYDSKQIDKFLEVTYISQPGRYRGCGNEFVVPNSKLIKVDPLSPISYTPYELKDRPEFRWEAESNELYTLVFYDVGYQTIQALYVNIKGDNISTAEVIQRYEGPLNPTGKDNPYMFLLFKQKGYIKMSAKWRRKFYYAASPFHFGDFKKSFNMTGPVALSLIRVTGDPYAADIARHLGYMNTCPAFISKDLKKKSIKFLPDDNEYRPQLSVYLNVTFKTESITFNSCCSIFSVPGRELCVNPLGNAGVESVYARNGPVVELSMATAFPSLIRDFKDKILTLALIDPDVPFEEFGNAELPFIHWLVVNIYSGRVHDGQEVLSYIGPTPPPGNPHTYYFMIFEQNYELDPKEVAEYGQTNCSSVFKGRCRFSVNDLVINHGLKLTGASWFITENDEFVRHVYVNLGMPRCQICKDVPQFAYPCPYSNSAYVVPSVVLSVVIFLLTSSFHA